MKKGLLILISIIILFVVVGVIGYNYMNYSYNKKMSDLVINEVDLDKIDNGIYIGSYTIFPIIVKVEVEVINHEITNINILEHQTGKGQPAEVIIDSVIDEQSLKVDTISKATGSSKVILKAIEDALTK